MYRRRRSIFDIMRDLEAEVEAEVESMLTRIKELELASRCLQPLYEIAEGPDEYVLRVDMPGAERDKIEIQASGRFVRIYAPCSYTVPYREGERTCATCYRLEVEMPARVSMENAKQKFRGGVLEIRFPKTSREFRIPVE
jgi:HSP20 family molecular chaperone IbpA